MNTKSIGASTGVQGATEKNVNQVQRNEAERTQDSRDSRKLGSQKDAVQVSEEGKRLQEFQAKVFQKAKETDAVREEKIEALKQQIAEGKYDLDSEKIADGFLTELMLDDAALRLHDLEKK